MNGEPLPWTSAQQAWLQAMGHVVFQDGALETAAPVGAEPWSAASPAGTVDSSAVQLSAVPARRSDAGLETAPSSAREVSVHAPASEPASPQRKPETGAQAADTPARAPRAGTARQPAVRLPDRLQIALLRASGRNPSDPATQALMETWPLDVLRGNPAAKRALWPQLRTLRRKGTS